MPSIWHADEPIGKIHSGAFSIVCASKPLTDPVIVAVDTITVTDEINVPAMFEFTLSLSGPRAAPSSVLDLFSPGDDVSIEMGLDKLTRLISGEITAVEPRFGVESKVTIRGFDRMYRLKFGKTTKVFENLSEADIVNQVARSIGLSVRTQGTGTEKNPYVQQRRQSNYGFLLMRAAELNCELLMDGTTLVFRASAEGKGALRELVFPRDIAELDVDLRVPTQGSKVTVRSFDFLTNKPISATSKGATRQDKMGGTVDGYQVAADFPDSAITIEQPGVASVAGLQAIADAQFQAHLNRFIQGGARLAGDPELKAGVNVTFSGLSKRFDGLYYITSSTHSFDEANGYSTQIKVRRTGI